MNAPGETPTPELDPKKPTHHKAPLGFYFFLIILFGAALLAAPYFLDKVNVKNTKPALTTTIVTPPSVLTREPKDEEQTLSKDPPKPDKKTAQEQTSAITEEIAKLRDEVTDLTAAMSALQTQVKQSTQAAEKSRSASRNEVSIAIAFTLVKAASMAGQGYTRELEALKTAASQDETVMTAVLQLEPMATTGAPTAMELKHMFDAFAPSVQTALDRTQAQSWKDRVLAELKSLINIRRVNEPGSPDKTVEAISHDLALGRLKEALAQADSLPEAAREPLREWREKAVTRQKMEAALDAIAERLIGQTGETR